MARGKKSRKGGPIGQRKDPNFKLNREYKGNSVKKGKGQQSGGRQQAASSTSSKTAASASQAQDKRLGSKQPIQLIKASPEKAQVVKKATEQKEIQQQVTSPEQQLAALEADPRLSQLIDQAEEGQELSPQDQKWLDKQLALHQQLLEELGLLEEDEMEPAAARDEDDLWDAFDNASLDDYKD